MEQFSATIEYIGNGAAIVALFDGRGQWSGAGRIEVKSQLKTDLYEAGYNDACVRARAHGGELGRYSEIKANNGTVVAVEVNGRSMWRLTDAPFYGRGALWALRLTPELEPREGVCWYRQAKDALRAVE